jgi:hypothetical protein
VVCSTGAFAQRGAWTGYVGGFQRDAVAGPAWFIGSRYVGPVAAPSRASWGTTQSVIVANSLNALTASTFLAQQQLAAQRDSLAAQQAQLEAQQLAAQQELAARQQALADRELALQRAALAEQQAQLARAREDAERARLEIDAASTATVQAQQQAEATREAARRQRELDERRAAPQTPGNPVFHWVDAEGVEHYSTKPRDAKP